jgi:hypothetical protein
MKLRLLLWNILKTYILLNWKNLKDTLVRPTKIEPSVYKQIKYIYKEQQD